ncbi:MAG: hypothetical protein AMS27_01190 [Bacteroides sp. SM23_62_1]|nr:MAG: hypothetical protein AMS27_01190 [Bacteroides sp. SM23_62_1]
MKLDLDEWIQQHIYFLGYFDYPGVQFLKKNLGEDDIFIDAGANIGSYTLIAAKQVGKTGRVYAFEPAGAAYKRLCENIEINEYSNIITEKKGLLDMNSTIDLFLANKTNLGMSSIYHHDSESGTVERIETTKLDVYVDNQNITRVDLIKLDIEGSEMLALQGMQKTLEKFKPKVLIELKEETHARSEYSINDIIGYLNSHGYEKWYIDDKGDCSRDIENKPEGYYNFLFIPAIPETSER